MKMPNVIKNVLAKASPRNRSRSSSTSEDEDEDIFGGLETEDDASKIRSKTPKKSVKAPSPTNESSTLFPSDPSGTVVESDVTQVESDITSSILGAKKTITPKNLLEEDAKTTKAKTSNEATKEKTA